MSDQTTDKTIPIQLNPLADKAHADHPKPQTISEVIQANSSPRTERRKKWLRVLPVAFILMCLAALIIAIFALSNLW